MARRSSARLRERNASATPTRDSFSHDAIVKTPQTMPARLPTLQEDADMPGTFPSSVSPTVTRFERATTPPNATPIKPAEEEMHPQLYHQSTAKPRDEARHLGFSNMAPHTEPPRRSHGGLPLANGTPTRVKTTQLLVDPPAFEFTFRREHSLGLSPEAKKLMDEKREEAAKIREQMIASGEAKQLAEARRIATPKRVSGRFSKAHTQAFNKMDSIAGHPSAFRANPNHIKASLGPSSKPSPGGPSNNTQPIKTLKRKQSKVELDSPVQYPSLPASTTDSRSTPRAPTDGQPPNGSAKKARLATPEAQTSPAKRVKITQADDASTSRTPPTQSMKSIHITPRSKLASVRSARTDLPSFASPTRSSATRNTPAKFSKIPAFTLTPGKQTTQSSIPVPVEKPATPLLLKSPSKASLFGKPEAVSQGPVAPASPMLARSPSKLGLSKKQVDLDETTTTVKDGAVSLMSQSPTRALASSIVTKEKTSDVSQEAPLLSRSPTKTGLAKLLQPVQEPSTTTSSSATPFLARSPAKLPLADITESVLHSSATPNKNSANILADRFQLLRQTPVKSILRSPQRLYSDDPAKIAAGTHLATPPVFEAQKSAGALGNICTPATTQKRVDFTSSTKAREKEASSTPDCNTTPSPTIRRTPMASFKSIPTAETEQATDPALSLSPSPQKRRQTATPRDFTFRVGDPIVFAPTASPRAPAHVNGPATIRHVSVDSALTTVPTCNTPAPPLTGSKKRKLEFESQFPAGTTRAQDGSGHSSDKENTPNFALDSEGKDEDHRPAKRVKSSAPTSSLARDKTAAAKPASAPAPAPATRRPTLGVKPKKVTGAPIPARKPLSTTTMAAASKAKPAAKPSTISRDRLNALAQPKRRA